MMRAMRHSVLSFAVVVVGLLIGTAKLGQDQPWNEEFGELRTGHGQLQCTMVDAARARTVNVEQFVIAPPRGGVLEVFA